MARKIITFLLLPMLILAFFLAFAGVKKIEFGNSYYTFIKNVSDSYDSWSLTIPDIPKISKFELLDTDLSFWERLFEMFKMVANFFITLINIIISVVNFLAGVVNVIINVLQFIFTLLYQCKDFIGDLSSNVRVCVN